MTNPERRADAESRVRKAHATLGAAKALLALDPPCRDDAVNRAAMGALQAARALVDSQWARDSHPEWDPNWRPGMLRAVSTREGVSLEALQKLLDRFERLSANLKLAPDFTQYLRTLVEDGLAADSGEAPEYDEDEARVAIATSEQLVMTVAAQLGIADELRALAAAHDHHVPRPPAEAAQRP
jgi:FMN phosphatase YigB (HAD superfamily)